MNFLFLAVVLTANPTESLHSADPEMLVYERYGVYESQLEDLKADPRFLREPMIYEDASRVIHDLKPRFKASSSYYALLSGGIMTGLNIGYTLAPHAVWMMASIPSVAALYAYYILYQKDVHKLAHQMKSGRAAILSPFQVQHTAALHALVLACMKNKGRPKT